jgi:hypothetical protein
LPAVLLQLQLDHRTWASCVYDHHANRKTKNQPKFPLATCCIPIPQDIVIYKRSLVGTYFDEKERSLC